MCIGVEVGIWVLECVCGLVWVCVRTSMCDCTVSVIIKFPLRNSFTIVNNH